jgi:Protein of unknown function (DUF4013)
MSNPSSFGPFPDPAPKPPGPAAVAAAAPQEPGQLEYLRTFQYIFDNPNWLMNLVWSFLCQLAGQVIPIVPAMVFMGYQFEMLEDMRANRGTRYPDFDINRLVDYLGRGVWPILVMLIGFLGIGAAVGMVALATMICAGILGAAGGEDLAGVLVPIGVVIGGTLGIAVALLASIYVTPMVLKAGLAQDLGAAFDFAWVNDFARKMWVETVLSGLFMFGSVLALVLVTCGLAGIILGPMLPFVSTHFYYQLYSMYLARGGTPIPQKPRAPTAQPGYVPPQQY